MSSFKNLFHSEYLIAVFVSFAWFGGANLSADNLTSELTTCDFITEVRVSNDNQIDGKEWGAVGWVFASGQKVELNVRYPLSGGNRLEHYGALLTVPLLTAAYQNHLKICYSPKSGTVTLKN